MPIFMLNQAFGVQPEPKDPPRLVSFTSFCKLRVMPYPSLQNRQMIVLGHSKENMEQFHHHHHLIIVF